jgi:hypothetical protein
MRERRRKNFSEGTKFGILMGPAALVVSFILILTVTLIYQGINEAHFLKHSASINEYEKKKVELQEQKERLQIEATRLQSILEIQKSTSAISPSKFVPVKTVNYLPPTNVAVK